MVHSIFDPEILRPRKADAQRERSRDVLTYVHALYEAVSTPGIHRPPTSTIRYPQSSLFKASSSRAASETAGPS
jgi:hypothetical protein